MNQIYPISLSGHNVFDAVSDGGAIPLLRAEPQRGREAVGGMVSGGLSQ